LTICATPSAYACRCQARVCDRYFAAVVRDAHDRGNARRSAEWRQRRATGDARRTRVDAARRAADLDEHPERRLHEGLDLLVESWRPTEQRFLADGALARVWLRRAVELIHVREPLIAADRIEAHVRAWEAARHEIPRSLCDHVRGVLRRVITDLAHPTSPYSPSILVGAMISPSTRSSADNQRLSPSPHLRI
jgi:hypothetical protein